MQGGDGSRESRGFTVRLAELHLVVRGKTCLKAFRVLTASDGEDLRGLGFQGGIFLIHDSKTETLGDERVAEEAV